MLVVSIAAASVFSAQAPAQVRVASRVSSGVACDQAESALVSLYVHKRDEGAPVEQLLAMFAALPDGDRTKAEADARIRDAYLDAQLSAQTVRAYRTAKCARQLGAQDYRAFDGLARSRLLACQATGVPGDRALSKCIHALLDDLERERAQRAGS